MWVLQNKKSNKFVAKAEGVNHYTYNLAKAEYFETVEKAFSDIVSNDEIIVHATDAFFMMKVV